MTLRSRDISLPTKVHIVKAFVFPVVIFECENWTIKKTEHWRTDVFELWCWRRLESPLDCKEIKPVNPKQINPEYSLEGLMLKLKLQYFGNLMRRTDSLEKTVMLGKIEGRKRRGWLRTRWLDGITDSMDLNVNRLREKVKNREAWHSPWSHQELDNNWTTTLVDLENSYSFFKTEANDNLLSRKFLTLHQEELNSFSSIFLLL